MSNSINTIFVNGHRSIGLIAFILVISAALSLSVAVFPLIFILAFVCIAVLIPTVLVWPLAAYALILITVPSYNMSVFRIGKVDIRPNDLAIIFGLVALFIHWIRQKKIVIDIKEYDVTLIILFGWICVSIFWTPKTAMGVFTSIKIFAAMLIYFVMINLIRDRVPITKVLFVWLIVGIFWAIAGVYTVYFLSIPAAAKLKIIEGTVPHLGKTVRASTFFGGPNDYAFVLSIMTMMIILYYSLSSSRAVKWLCASSILMMIIVIIGTFSRKSWLGLGMSIFIIGLMKRKILLMIGILSLVSIFSILLWSGEGQFSYALINRVESFFLATEVTIDERVAAWAVAEDMFAGSPLLGRGVGSFFVLGPLAGSPLNIPHNFYWYLLSELGLVGISLFFIFVIYHVFHLIKIFMNTKDPQYKYISLLLLATIASIIFQAGFKTIGMTEPIFWSFWAFVSIFLRMHDLSAQNLKKEIPA